ncbi:MAG TPA: hypothetical protein VGQ21_00175 [Thermoanaerobaculia bacterium]|jgi:hypothetical protein|nr:hypothetical protein [Thermoanaerobaculia bacterium]
MGLLDRFRKKKDKAAPAKPARSSEDEPSEPIVAFDGYGRRVEISRDEWRRNVLPHNLRQAWNDADALYGHIVSALNDGFASELASAARRLESIDNNPERGSCIRAIVEMRLEQPAEAESALRKYIVQHGESGVIVTNLAKALAAQGVADETVGTTLWHALQLDPNQDNAVRWFAARERERAGDGAYIAALKRLADEEHSWRAMLWLARTALERRDIQTALALYRDVIVAAAAEPGVLMQVSGDLGKNGYVQEIADLVVPIYDPRAHDITAGFNCLEALLQLGDRVRGELLLHQLMLLDLAPYKEASMKYAAAFTELAAEPPRCEQFDSPELFELMRLDAPIWLLSLGETDWLLPRNDSSGPIAIMALADATPRLPLEDGEVIHGAEDTQGRLCRGIALYLADVVRFRGASPAVVFVPALRGRGVVLEGGEQTPERAQDLLSESKVERLITGSLSQVDGEFQIRLTLHRTGSRTPQIIVEVSHHTLDELIAAVEQAVLASLAAPPSERMDEWFRKPSTDIRGYLDALAQMLMLGITANGVLPRASLFGERQILRWLLDVALANQDAPIPKVMFLSGLASSRRMGSDAWREFEGDAVRLFQGLPKSSPVYRLTPMLFSIFGRTADFQRRRDELMHSGDDEYVRWLGEIETIFSSANKEV